MISEFLSFLHENVALPCDIHHSPSGIYVDLDSDLNLGRVTLWDDNSCVMEILAIESGATLLCDSYEFASFSELIEKFEEFQIVLLGAHSITPNS